MNKMESLTYIFSSPSICLEFCERCTHCCNKCVQCCMFNVYDKYDYKNVDSKNKTLPTIQEMYRDDLLKF